MTSLIFDIETGPLPDDILDTLLPPFDEAAVKTGNYGPEKAKEKIERERAAHREKFFERAALSPATGRVLAIGTKEVGDEECLLSWVDDTITESALIAAFWLKYSMGEHRLVGFNSHRFDLPFLVRRSWILNVNVPLNLYGRGRFQNSVDLLEEWQLTNRTDYISLDQLSKTFCLPGKSDNGADFAKMFEADIFPESSRNAALDYLRNDVQLTWELARRMQVI